MGALDSGRPRFRRLRSRDVSKLTARRASSSYDRLGMKRFARLFAVVPQGGRIGALAGAFVASLCCLGPVLVAALGIVSIPVAGALANRMFYTYWWAFVGVGLTVTVVALVPYLRGRGICSVDAALRRRAEIRNAVLATILVFAVTYLVWDFVVVEAIGIWMHIWKAPI